MPQIVCIFATGTLIVESGGGREGRREGGGEGGCAEKVEDGAFLLLFRHAKETSVGVLLADVLPVYHPGHERKGHLFSN